MPHDLVEEESNTAMVKATNSESGWRWWFKVLVGPVVAVLVSMGVFQRLSDTLRGKGQVLAIVGGIALWTAVAVLTVYFFLKRQLHREFEHLRKSTFTTVEQHDDPINWNLPHQALFTEMQQPVLRAGSDFKLVADFFAGTHQRVPEETKIIEWSVRFNLAGQQLQEWTYKAHDICLETVGRTKLYPTPEASTRELFAMTPLEMLKGMQLPVSCNVFLLVRVPGRAEPVKLNEGSWTCICKVVGAGHGGIDAISIIHAE